MAMRLSGLMSGMDTESIIQQLVEAKSTKVKTAKKAQTKLDWKRDAWKELNTKLKNLQSKFLSNMRFSSAYSKKVTKVSNPNAVSVITGENAVNGVQSLEIEQLAKTGYMTGGAVADKSSNVDATTKLSELGFTGDGEINVKAGSTSVDIKVTGDSTISDVLTQLKNAGLNASFDSKWKRFSISAKESGADNDFSISAVDGDGLKALSTMKLVNLNSDPDNMSADYKEYLKYSGYVGADDAATLANLQQEIENDINSRTASYLAQYKSLYASLKTAEGKTAGYKDKYDESTKTYEDQVKDRNDRIALLNENLNAQASPMTDEEKQKAREEIEKLQTEVKELQGLVEVKNYTKQIDEVKQNIDITGEGESATATATAALESKVEAYQLNKANTAAKVIADPDAYNSATKVSGQDAKIYLNGALYENSNNSFEINGLTFTALNETKGEKITVTTEQDVDGIYDMVKNFLKEYNSIINEMDKLYNAESARGYEPLSDEEREAMSEKDAEKYEEKIKNSLLRRDENLSSLSSALKSVMSSGIEVDGKTMYLFDFGIETLSYFTAAENEKNAYHIAGDPDDTSTSGEADKLKTMIANDPSTVISFFTKMSQNMYDKMTELSKSVDGVRTFGSFYDDKKMKSDYDDYTSKIKDLEKKLNDYEDKWYKKFAAMETTMAKMQQNSSAVTALLGGS